MRVTLAFTLPLALALAACGSETSQTFEGEDGEVGELKIDSDTGETNLTITTDEGTMTMRSGSDVPVKLPGGFSVYPGAEVVSNMIMDQADGSGALLTLSSEDSPQEVAAFYKKQAEDAGITIQMEMTTNGAQMVGGESDKGLTFSIMASPEGDGTTAQLTVSDETQ